MKNKRKNNLHRRNPLDLRDGKGMKTQLKREEGLVESGKGEELTLGENE